MAQRKRSRVYPAEAIRRARELYQDGQSPSAILVRLQLDGIDPLPHLNTVKSWVSGLRRDTTAPWSLGAKDGGPDPEPDLVLPVLGYVLEAGIAESLTTWEARVVTRVRIARPDLPPDRVWQLARALITAEESGDAEARNAAHASIATRPETFRQGVADGRWQGATPGTATAESTVFDPDSVQVQPIHPYSLETDK